MGVCVRTAPPPRRRRNGKPKWPPGRLLRETDPGPYCPECGSSQEWPLGFVGKFFGASPKGCINMQCDSFWGLPNWLRPEKLKELDGIEAEVARTESSGLPGASESSGDDYDDLVGPPERIFT